MFFLYSVKKCYKKKKKGERQAINEEKKGGEGEKNLQTTKIKKSKKEGDSTFLYLAKSTPPTHTRTPTHFLLNYFLHIKNAYH